MRLIREPLLDIDDSPVHQGRKDSGLYHRVHYRAHHNLVGLTNNESGTQPGGIYK